MKSASFPDYFSEKIISIDKIPAFLQAFEHVISIFKTTQSGIWVGLLVTPLLWCFSYFWSSFIGIEVLNKEEYFILRILYCYSHIQHIIIIRIT